MNHKSKPTILGLITARGGSKGIAGKNIVDLGGKPLIAWTIEAGLQSRMLSRILVSTEDQQIAEISRTWGAEVPFMRPARLAEDLSPHMDTVVHALETIMQSPSPAPDWVMLLQPTSPFRTSEDIDEAVLLAIEKNAMSVISVVPTPAHPYFMYTISDKGTLQPHGMRPEGYWPRQRLPEVYVENGAIYLIRTDLLLHDKSWRTETTLPYIMPVERSLDIDTPMDLALARCWVEAGTSFPNLDAIIS